jgi:hypothetical protein
MLWDSTGMAAIGPGDPNNEFGDQVYVGSEVVVTTERDMGPDLPVEVTPYHGPHSQTYYTNASIDRNNNSRSQTNPSDISGLVKSSQGGQLNLVGFYGKVSWFMSVVAGQDYGFLYCQNVGWETYRTDHFGIRTEAATVGPGAGLIYYTGNPAELESYDFGGVVWDIQLNFSVTFGDAGGVIGISPVQQTAGGENGVNYLLFLGVQGSVGLSTPVSSGGVTKGRTHVHSR